MYNRLYSGSAAGLPPPSPSPPPPQLHTHAWHRPQQDQVCVCMRCFHVDRMQQQPATVKASKVIAPTAPDTADVRKMGAIASVAIHRAARIASSLFRTRKGRLRTPGFFKTAARFCRGRSKGWGEQDGQASTDGVVSWQDESRAMALLGIPHTHVLWQRGC